MGCAPARACPGKVGTGFPIRTCAKSRNLALAARLALWRRFRRHTARTPEIFRVFAAIAREPAGGGPALLPGAVAAIRLTARLVAAAEGAIAPRLRIARGHVGRQHGD